MTVTDMTAPEPQAGRRRIIPSPRCAALLRDPMFGFVLVGAFVFALNEWLQQPAADTIRVDAALVAALVEQHTLLNGKPPDSAGREALIQRYIDEEVLVRSAYQMGLDRGDGRVRQQLINKMNFILEEEPPEPGTADLRAIYEAAPADYQSPSQVDLLQISLGKGGVGADQHRELEAGRLAPGTLGTTSHLHGVVETELAAVIGNEEAAALMASPVGRWHGPYRGPASELMLQVVASRPAAPYAEEQLLRFLREDWDIMQRQALRRGVLDRLRRSYRIEIEHLAADIRVAGR